MGGRSPGSLNSLAGSGGVEAGAVVSALFPKMWRMRFRIMCHCVGLTTKRDANFI